MECALGCLKPGEKYSGVIVREPNGHRFITVFTNKPEHVEKIKKRLNMVKEKGRDVNIVETVLSEKKEEILEKIQNLNKKGGFTGVNIIPDDPSY